MEHDDFQRLLAEATEATLAHDNAQEEAQRLGRAAYRAEQRAWGACLMLPKGSPYDGYTYEQFRSVLSACVVESRGHERPVAAQDGGNDV